MRIEKTQPLVTPIKKVTKLSKPYNKKEPNFQEVLDSVILRSPHGQESTKK